MPRRPEADDPRGYTRPGTARCPAQATRSTPSCQSLVGTRDRHEVYFARLVDAPPHHCLRRGYAPLTSPHAAVRRWAREHGDGSERRWSHQRRSRRGVRSRAVKSRTRPARDHLFHSVVDASGFAVWPDSLWMRAATAKTRTPQKAAAPSIPAHTNILTVPTTTRKPPTIAAAAATATIKVTETMALRTMGSVRAERLFSRMRPARPHSGFAISPLATLWSCPNPLRTSIARSKGTRPVTRPVCVPGPRGAATLPGGLAGGGDGPVDAESVARRLTGRTCGPGLPA